MKILATKTIYRDKKSKMQAKTCQKLDLLSPKTKNVVIFKEKYFF